MGSSTTGFRNGSPVEPKTLAVPADHGVGLHDNECVFPSRPDLRERDPKGAVDRGDPRLGPSLGVGGKRLAQGGFGDRLLFWGAKEGEDSSKAQELVSVDALEGAELNRQESTAMVCPRCNSYIDL